jgi:hypothetical protein
LWGGKLQISGGNVRILSGMAGILQGKKAIYALDSLKIGFSDRLLKIARP